MKVQMRCTHLAIAAEQNPDQPFVSVATFTRDDSPDHERLIIKEDRKNGPAFEIGRPYYVEVTEVPGR